MRSYMNLFLCLGLLSVFLVACGQEEGDSSKEEALTLDTPPDSVTLFAPGLISTDQNVRDLALSPDGRELFYTIVSPFNTFSAIVRLHQTASGWSQPEIATFSGRYSDLEPAFSPDGERLFFVSNRPLAGQTGVKDFDIWYVERSPDGWGEPVNVGVPVNSEANEFYPSVAIGGNLYFTAAYENSKGLEDIYLSRFQNGRYLPPISLDSAINTASYEFNAFVSPQEDLLIFTSYGRPDGLGGGDLYLSRKDARGHWLPARHLEAPFNSTGLDYCPFISADNRLFFFTSNRTSIREFYETAVDLTTLDSLLSAPQNGTGNIYWAGLDALGPYLR